eukprot:TRINITY_DN2969_c1_g1_i1.p1 TRINITY_DN2969_c1_g1~~TRINITY_DN2969_c1_g1_i1.p1  ORF type:complete len:558 (+),score=161.22 TRINITY_DN2969_c1_g1_i1:55-1728(+)
MTEESSSTSDDSKEYYNFINGLKTPKHSGSLNHSLNINDFRKLGENFVLTTNQRKTFEESTDDIQIQELDLSLLEKKKKSISGELFEDRPMQSERKTVSERALRKKSSSEEIFDNIKSPSTTREGKKKIRPSIYNIPNQIKDRKNSVTQNVSSVKNFLFKLVPSDLLFGLLSQLIIECRKNNDFITLNSIIELLEYRSQKINFISYIIQNRINETKTGDVILRESSFETWFLSFYFRVKGEIFITSVLMPILEIMMNYPESFEINPQKIKHPMFMKSHLLNISSIATTLIDSIIDNIQFIPIEIRKVITIIKNIARVKYQNDKVAMNGAFSIFFLRFICISLVCPSDFGVPENLLTENLKSPLIVISKILGCWSNDILYEEEHPLYHFNTWLKENNSKKILLTEKLLLDENQLKDETYNPVEDPNESKPHLNGYLHSIEKSQKFSSYLMKKIVFYGLNENLDEDSSESSKDNSKNNKNVNKDNKEKNKEKEKSKDKKKDKMIITPEIAYKSVYQLLKKNQPKMSEKDFQLVDRMEMYVNLDHKKSQNFAVKTKNKNK